MPAHEPGAGAALLLVEDATDLGAAVAEHLRAAGHRVNWCRSLAQARAAPAPAMALLDLRLPDGDGLTLLHEWRAAGQHWPVIVLTARDQISDRIRGLQAGADDYLVKPFDLDELLARINAVARRTDAPLALAGGALRLDIPGHVVWRDSQAVALTHMEWAVLACLAQRRGQIFSRDQIESWLHGRGLADAASNSLEVIVSRLRRKLGASALSTHRGLGYRLEP